MDVFKLTRELGKAIQETNEYKNFVAATKRNEEDEQLQGYIGEYNIINMNMENAMSGEKRDDEMIKKCNVDMRELYNKIMVNESMIAYNEAKKALQELMNKVNGIIDLCVAGEDPETCEPQAACTGNCSSCGGCH